MRQQHISGLQAERTDATRSFRALAGAGTVAVAAMLAGCGGGAGDGASPPQQGSNTASMTVSGVVADGPLQGAQVCLDTNDNGRCDTGEPLSGATDADGRYSLNIPTALAGRHALVAQVPASAVDKDQPGQPVGVAFTLRAPPSQETAVFVSPLTTLVADAVSGGLPAATAVAQVQQQLGLVNSPLADFTRNADAQAALIARTVNTVMLEVTRLAEAQGVPADQTQALVRQVSGADLPLLAARAQSAAAQATGSSHERLLEASRAAAQGVLTDRNISASTVRAQAGIAKALSVAGEGGTETRVAETFVRRFIYSDPANYSIRLLTHDLPNAQADGTFPINETRIEMVAGRLQPFNRNWAWWTGREWQTCENAWQVSKSVAQTASEPQRTVFCGGGRSESRSVTKDISGQRMADVVAELRGFPLRDNDGWLPANWGPNPALLGDAVFPPGSRLNTRQAVSEIGGADLQLLAVKPVLPQGRNAETLEELMTAFVGTYARADGIPDGTRAAYLDEVSVAPDRAGLLPVQRYFASFGPDRVAVRFQRCDVQTNGLPTGCVALGAGTVAISTLGDSRIMRFDSGYPVDLLAARKRQATWIERHGVVFSGLQMLPNLHHNQRLNGVAWAALRDRLGIPAHTEPAAPDPLAPFKRVHSFSYTDAGNWFYRQAERRLPMLASVANEYEESRHRMRQGAMVTDHPTYQVWNGLQWQFCSPLSGPGSFNPTTLEESRCGAFQRTWQVTSASLDGRLLSDVLYEIRRYPGQSSWGADPAVHAAALAGARFAAGSRLEYATLRQASSPMMFDSQGRDRVRVPPNLMNTDQASWPLANTLDTVLVAYTGLNAQPVMTGNQALYFHGLFLDAPVGDGLTSERQYRVSFDPVGNRATYWRNHVSSVDGQPVDFVALGSTTWRIDLVGGQRVLRLADAPPGMAGQGVDLVLVEWQGSVHRAQPEATQTGPLHLLRLNGPAWDSLRQALGVPAP